MPTYLACIGGRSTHQSICIREGGWYQIQPQPEIYASFVVSTTLQPAPLAAALPCSKQTLRQTQIRQKQLPRRRLSGILDQVAQNQIDLPAAVKANAEATNEVQQGVLAVDELLGINSTAAATGGLVQAAATASAKSGKNGRKGARTFISWIIVVR